MIVFKNFSSSVLISRCLRYHIESLHVVGNDGEK